MYRLQHRPSQRAGRASILIVCTALVAGAAAVWLVGSHNTTPPKIIANDLSGRPTACLAADSRTAAESSEVTQTWSEMLSGAKGLKINVQQLILAAKNPSQATPYLAGLLEQHCTLVVTVGVPFGQAIPAGLKVAPRTRFIAVDGGALPANSALQSVTSSNGPLVYNQVRSLAGRSEAAA
jgi:basic membrane lipoprotein Med (substrate-binding protein (PBP1-ABC) superfamily)